MEYIIFNNDMSLAKRTNPINNYCDLCVLLFVEAMIQPTKNITVC